MRHCDIETKTSRRGIFLRGEPKQPPIGGIPCGLVSTDSLAALYLDYYQFTPRAVTMTVGAHLLAAPC
jgi:hypothetical protein